MTKDGTDVVELASETIGTRPGQTLCWKRSGGSQPVILREARRRLPDNLSRAG
jgi:hypothetical protein